MTARQITFSVQNNQLVRHVRLADGRSYRQTCTRAVFEEVAEFVEANRGARLSILELYKALSQPLTQLNVALAFLAEYTLVERCGRWHCAAAEFLYEDALAAFYHLAEVGT
jgi:hypothetical protein